MDTDLKLPCTTGLAQCKNHADTSLHQISEWRKNVIFVSVAQDRQAGFAHPNKAGHNIDKLA